MVVLDWLASPLNSPCGAKLSRNIERLLLTSRGVPSTVARFRECAIPTGCYWAGALQEVADLVALPSLTDRGV